MGIPDWLQKEVNDYFFKPLNVNPTTVLDIGANIGAFALRAHIEWPAARVICYEPMPFNIEALLGNVSAAWCQVEPFAVRAQAGDADIYIGDMFVTGGFKRWGRQTEKTIRVPCVAANAIPSCDLVKIDTEGCEVEILSGLELSRTQAILLEYHSRADAKTIMRMLTPQFTVMHKSGREIGTIILERAT